MCANRILRANNGTRKPKLYRRARPLDPSKRHGNTHGKDTYLRECLEKLRKWDTAEENQFRTIGTITQSKEREVALAPFLVVRCKKTVQQKRNICASHLCVENAENVKLLM